MTDALSVFQARIDEQLGRRLTTLDAPDRLREAMRYAVVNGGKRLRPGLVYLATQALGKPLELADSSACAIEMIHAYSLIHDDLPAMDNDTLRRGLPTCHIKFGEATAILAGDALQALAFETIAGDEKLDPAIRVELIRNIAVAAGASGMVGGQVIDMESEMHQIDSETLTRMHRCKTGDLISISVACGAIIARADQETRLALQQFGHALGLAFQVRDDILDEVGETGVIGKLTGSDRARHKSTFVSLHGLNSATAQLDDLRRQAIDAIKPLGAAGAQLAAIADFVAQRNH